MRPRRARVASRLLAAIPRRLSFGAASRVETADRGQTPRPKGRREEAINLADVSRPKRPKTSRGCATLINLI